MTNSEHNTDSFSSWLLGQAENKKADKCLGVFALCAVFFILYTIYSTSPNYVVFSNDGPLGSLVNAQTSMPSSTVALWEDSNWIGGPGIARITDPRPGWSVIWWALWLVILPCFVFWYQLKAKDFWLITAIFILFFGCLWAFTVLVWEFDPKHYLALDPYSDSFGNWFGIGLFRSTLIMFLWGGIIMDTESSKYSKILGVVVISLGILGIVIINFNLLAQRCYWGVAALFVLCAIAAFAIYIERKESINYVH